MITLDLSILNQKGTPMFYSDIFANRPAAGVVGRIFISTDTYAIYRDTGSSWDQIGGSGSGITGSGTAGSLPIWTSSSALGDSSLLEGSTKISTIKDIQADGYYLTGMTLGTGALYFSTTPEDRVTLANYNVGGTVYVEVNGGSYAAKWGTDLSLTNYGYIAATPTLTAANNASSLASFGINTLSYAAGFSSNNIGALYGGNAGFNLQTFAGSATFAQANVASGGASVNSIDFSSAGSTITMTQSTGIRVMSGQQNLFQYQGTNSGTITHAAISQNTGFYRPSGASGILTITNAYSHLINALDDYGSGFTFTNRWGIYQAGASDINYFASKILIGSTVDNGVSKLQVTGNGIFSGLLTANNTIQATALYVPFKSISTSTTLYNEFYSNTSTLVGSIGNGNGIISGGGDLTFGIRAESDLIFASGGNNRRMTLNSSGNLGLGVQPSAWGSIFTALQIKNTSISAVNDIVQVIAGNSFYNGTAYAYIQNGFSNQLEINNTGSFLFKTAPTGTAGNAITFTQAMTLDASGKLLVGSTSDYGSNAKFLVQSGTIIGASSTWNNSTTGSSIEIFGNDASNGGVIWASRDGNQAWGSVALGPLGGNILIGTYTNPGQKLYLNGSLRIDGQSSGTAGGSSGQHLIINLDGTTYKIALLNP